MEYRAYPVGDDGHLLPPTVIVCDTDEAAIEKLKSLLNGRPIQMWAGRRLVGWFEIIRGEFFSVTSYSDYRPENSDITSHEMPS